MFFYLSQNFFKHVQQYNSLAIFNSCPEFRQTFNLCQALAFLPIEDVIVGFEIVKSKAPASFKKMFDFIERTYVGRYRENK